MQEAFAPPPSLGGGPVKLLQDGGGRGEGERALLRNHINGGHAPSRDDVESVTINAKVVNGEEAPAIKKRKKGGKKEDEAA